MLNRDDSKGRALVLASALLAWAGCGVQSHKVGGGPATGAAGAEISGAAGVGPGAAGSGSGLAGVSGAAGDQAGLAGVSGAAGDANTSGGSGTNGAAGDTGAAGTGGAAGVSGSAGTGGSATAGTGALSGVTVNIGGTNVPRENAIAFIHLGHSNMAGRGRNPSASGPYHFMQTDPHAWSYHSSTFAPYVNTAKAGFELAIEPKTAGDKFNTRTPSNLSAGPGTTLVKQAAALAPDKYFISVGFGVGSVFCSEYLPGGLYYDQVMNAAKELKGKVTFGAIVILLGITERHGTTADIDNFPSCINTLVGDIRRDVGEPNLPVLINGYEMCATRDLAPTSTFAKAIMPRIAAIPMMVANSAVIPTDNPLIPCEVEPNEPDGDHHFTLDGHKEYMRRLLQTMKDKGWWHW
jgi:hypothetical protein